MNTCDAQKGFITWRFHNPCDTYPPTILIITCPPDGRAHLTYAAAAGAAAEPERHARACRHLQHVLASSRIHRRVRPSMPTGAVQMSAATAADVFVSLRQGKHHLYPLREGVVGVKAAGVVGVKAAGVVGVKAAGVAAAARS
eukprot:350742-Chlamydomonas_euryale.AAC.16